MRSSISLSATLCECGDDVNVGDVGGEEVVEEELRSVVWTPSMKSPTPLMRKMKARRYRSPSVSVDVAVTRLRTTRTSGKFCLHSAMPRDVMSAMA